MYSRTLVRVGSTGVVVLALVLTLAVLPAILKPAALKHPFRLNVYTQGSDAPASVFTGARTQPANGRFAALGFARLSDGCIAYLRIHQQQQYSQFDRFLTSHTKNFYKTDANRDPCSSPLIVTWLEECLNAIDPEYRAMLEELLTIVRAAIGPP